MSSNFKYFGGEQRSPEWFKLRLGRVTASRLEDWLSVSKAKNSLGKPLKKRLDYERELMFERTFGVGFDNYVTDAMYDGIVFESFAKEQYQKIKDVQVDEVGCWYNDHFVASPDGVVGEDGLVEVKILRDNSFTDILTEGVPQKHWKQIQGQLWAAGRPWCDYIAANLNVKQVKVIRVEADKEFHDWLEVAVAEPLTIEPFSDEELYEFVDMLPEGEKPQVLADNSDSNLGF